jgi:hypothetical protein
MGRFDRVRPGRIDEVEVFEKGVRAEDLDDVLREIEVVGLGPYLKKAIRSVVGMTSALQKSSPKRALSKVDLPALTSPTTTKRKGSSRLARRFFNRARRPGLIPLPRPSSPSDSMVLLSFSRVWK